MISTLDTRLSLRESSGDADTEGAFAERKATLVIETAAKYEESLDPNSEAQVWLITKRLLVDHFVSMNRQEHHRVQVRHCAARGK